MAWFNKGASPKVRGDQKKASVPSGLFRKCDGCGAASIAEDVVAALQTCPECGHHFRIGGRERLLSFLDRGSEVEFGAGLSSGDPLSFTDSKSYPERIKKAVVSAEEEDAFLAMEGRLLGRAVVVGSFEFKFMGGSMGSVVGEKVALAFERGYEKQCPVVLFSSSGGARMQEGILSLMQMAKTSAAIARFREVRQPYISVLADPTTGGVAASFAFLGDIIVAEPGALIGFAGPRVIEQTIRQTLPEGFQRAEFLLEHGMVDMVVPRGELRTRLAQVVSMLSSGQ